MRLRGIRDARARAHRGGAVHHARTRPGGVRRRDGGGRVLRAREVQIRRGVLRLERRQAPRAGRAGIRPLLHPLRHHPVARSRVFALRIRGDVRAAPFAAPSLRAGAARTKTVPRDGSSTSSEYASDESLLGSDGEVRRWAAREKAERKRGSNADARARSSLTRRDGTSDVSPERDAGSRGAYFDEPSAPATSRRRRRERPRRRRRRRGGR